MTEKLVNIKDLSKKEWLKYRQMGIGGSDAAACCGLNKYKSPYKLYLEKKEDIEKEEISNEALRIGTDLEDYVAKRFSEETGKKVRKDNFMMVSEEYPFMLADIDRRVVGEDAILECKTTNAYNAKRWDDGEIPLEYQFQCYHYMAVTGAKKCYIACLILGIDFVCRELNWDEETIRLLIEAEKDFYTRFMQGDEIPLPDGSDSYSNALKEQFKGGVDESIALDDDIDYETYFNNKELIKDLETQNKEIEQIIQKQLGDSNRGENSKISVNWSPCVSKRLDSKRLKKEHEDLYNKYLNKTEYRRFTMKEIIND